MAGERRVKTQRPQRGRFRQGKWLRGSGGLKHLWNILIHHANQALDRIDLFLVKQRLAALRANPCRDIVDDDVIAVAIGSISSLAALEFALAVITGHFFFSSRCLKSGDH
jgi:hypothetical protein